MQCSQSLRSFERQASPDTLPILNILVTEELDQVLLFICTISAESRRPHPGSRLTNDPRGEKPGQDKDERDGRDEVAEQELRGDRPVKEAHIRRMPGVAGVSACLCMILRETHA